MPCRDDDNCCQGNVKRIRRTDDPESKHPFTLSSAKESVARGDGVEVEMPAGKDVGEADRDDYEKEDAKDAKEVSSEEVSVGDRDNSDDETEEVRDAKDADTHADEASSDEVIIGDTDSTDDGDQFRDDK